MRSMPLQTYSRDSQKNILNGNLEWQIGRASDLALTKSMCPKKAQIQNHKSEGQSKQGHECWKLVFKSRDGFRLNFYDR